jgi:hypothetical protein
VSAAEAALKRAQAGLAAAQKLAPTGGGRRPPAPLSGRDSARKVAGLPKEAGRPPVTIGGRDVKDVGVLSERSSKEKPEEPPPKDEAKPQSGDDEETGE